MAIDGKGSLLEAARVSRGLTQAMLAERSGVAQGVISKFESGRLAIDDRIEKLAAQLNVPKALVDGTTRQVPHIRVFHRKQASLPAKASNKLRADLMLAHTRVDLLLGSRLSPPVKIPRLPLESALETPADRAREIRKLWAIPDGPIGNMVSLLESRGIPCLMWNVESARVDAIASWPEDARPIVMLGNHAPGDRLRFTVAHELGHAVMHEVPSANCEGEADEFAAEFLMPRAELYKALRGATLPTLADMKRTWGTSIASLARRARDTGAITDSAYRSLNIELSSSGMRKHEPVHIQREQPALISSVIHQRLEEGESLAEQAEMALICVDELRSGYLEVT